MLFCFDIQFFLIIIITFWHVSEQLSVLVVKSQVMCVPDPERTR